MENNENYQQEIEEVKVTSEVKSYFVEAANWGTFLAILGYIFIALLVIFAIFLMVAGGKISQGLEAFDYGYGMQATQAFKLGSVFTGVVMLIVAVFYFFPVYFLHQFSSKVKHAVKSGHQEAFGVGIKNLKSLFKFMGIVTIVILAIYVLALIFMLIGVAIAT